MYYYCTCGFREYFHGGAYAIVIKYHFSNGYFATRNPTNGILSRQPTQNNDGFLVHALALLFIFLPLMFWNGFTFRPRLIDLLEQIFHFDSVVRCLFFFVFFVVSYAVYASIGGLLTGREISLFFSFRFRTLFFVRYTRRLLRARAVFRI